MNTAKTAEVAAFERGDELGRRNIRQLFRPKGLRGRRPDGGRLVLGRRSAAIQPPAGDGRCPGRSPAPGRVETFGGSDPRPQRAAARRAPDRSRSRPRRCRFPMRARCSPDRNPYADAAAPYKVDHLQASGKFPEPLLNTPKTVTVLSKEVLADENATSLKQAVLNTAGVTLGTGEGGNAFGDRFFVRGFDTRNDVFIDGVRDSGVSVRENFFTEQIEILRGPGSSFAGRGTTGGAINIVTKQATTEKSSTTWTRRSRPTTPSASRSTSTR